jgi:hypothetical protein
MCLYKLTACVHNQNELLLITHVKSYYVTVPQAQPLLQTHWQTFDMRLAPNTKTGCSASLRNGGWGGLHHPFSSPHNTSLSPTPHCDTLATTRHQTPYIAFFVVIPSHMCGNVVYFRWISGEWMSNVVHLSEVGRPLNYDCTARAVSTVCILPGH